MPCCSERSGRTAVVLYLGCGVDVVLRLAIPATALVAVGMSASQPVTLGWPFADLDWVQPPGRSWAHVGDDSLAEDWWRGTSKTHGALVRAPIAGEVIQAERTCSAYGRVVAIYNQPHRILVRLAHLDNFVARQGDRVLQKDSIGIVGRSGPRANFGSEQKEPQFAHLHVAVYRRGEDGARPREPRLTGSSKFAVPFVTTALVLLC
jgi:murein DD-endopeptidase MepM/ murein hydrolase activator NlpD